MPSITVLGLGPGDISSLSVQAWELIQSGRPLYLRTAVHPAAVDLVERRVHFTSFDSFYETGESFSDVYQTMADTLWAAAADADIIYAVPGHPLMAELSVQHLLEKSQSSSTNITVDIGPGQSFLDPVCAMLQLDPIDGLLLLDATNLNVHGMNPAVHTLIAQVYSRSVAADVKLTLMDLYPDDYPVTLIRAAGVPTEEQMEQLPLYELDRVDWIDHLTTLYIPAAEQADVLARHSAYPTDLVRRLREPGGCPWDRKQTHETLRKYVLEEAYEVVQAINEDDMDSLADELGDLLLQILLHAQIATERGDFTVMDVYAKLSDKLLRRHPHVFGAESAASEAEAELRWREAKAQERDEEETTALAGLKRAQPPLRYVRSLQEKAASVGMEFGSVSDVAAKVREEIDEIEQALVRGETQHAVEEVGDLVFATVNLARWLSVDPDTAAVDGGLKFERRIRMMEAQMRKNGHTWGDYSPEELDMLWKNVKTVPQDADPEDDSR